MTMTADTPMLSATPHSMARGRRTAGGTVGGLFAALDREWTEVLSEPRNASEFDQFVAAHPGLDSLRRSPSPAHWGRVESDAALHALLAAHHRGSALAGRTVLQCMLPAARALVRRCHWRYSDREEASAHAVAALWGAIARCDLARTERIATRLHGAVLTAVAGDRAPGGRRPSEAVREIPAGGAIDALEAGALPVVETELIGPLSLGTLGEVFEVLAAGVESGAITSDERELLVRLYAPDPARPEHAQLGGAFQRAVAADLGITHAALRQRASRAVRRLARAIRCGDCPRDVRGIR